VNTDDKSYQKTILRDPLAALLAINPEIDQNTTSALKHLFHDYADLKARHKKVKQDSNTVSRQIGQALKNGHEATDLKCAMKEHSTQLGDVKNKLVDAEKQILEFFIENNKCNTQQDDRVSATPRWKNPGDKPAQDITVTLLQHDLPTEWDTYVHAHPAATMYHQSTWKKLIQQSHGHEGCYFIAHNNEKKVVGVLPLIHMQSRLFGDFLVSMPYFNYGGAIADSLSIENKLICKASSYAKKLGVSHVEYRDNIPRDKLPVRAEKVNMILDLPETHDNLWDSFSSKLRAQIRRAQREKTRVNIGGKECLNDFYSVFARNMRDLGTPVYGKSFFSNILCSFPDHSKIIVVFMGNRPVAAAFLLGYKNTLEIPWASTIGDVNHLSINMLLYWEVLKFALENRCAYFDFGRSSKNSGTFRFKQQWGAKAKQMYWHYWLPSNAELPGLNPHNPKYAMAIKLWKRLPIFVTKWIGPLIVRNLP